MPFKVSIFWQVRQRKEGGWSENFWSNLTNFSRVETAAIALKRQLQRVHGNQAYAVNIRISEIGSFRNVENVSLIDQPKETTVSGEGDTDFVTTALLIRLLGNPYGETRQWIRGLKDADIANNGRWRPTPDTQSGINILRGELSFARNGWCINVQNPGTPEKPILGISQAGLVNVQQHGYVDFNNVRIKKAKGSFPVNKLWKITVPDVDHFQLVGYVPTTDPAVYHGGGVAVKQTKTLLPISDLKEVGATSIKTGRPFGLLSGRQRRKKKGQVGILAAQ